ncbi:MAG: hypothetical protein ACAH95_09125 [Fimbriimonas sp.]
MYRRDAGRTGASQENLKLPLLAAWTHVGETVSGKSALSTAVAKGKALYFVSGVKSEAKGGPKTQRELLAVESDTGKIVWRKKLSSNRLHPFMSEDVGPVISQEGAVYIVDLGKDKMCPSGAWTVMALSDKDGSLVEKSSMPMKQLLPRFFVRKGHGEEDFLLNVDAKPDS